MTVLIETVKLPGSGHFQVDLQLTADIRVSAETAMKEVGVLKPPRLAYLVQGDND